jgi:3-hydroxyacyl-CoA dehydrogenase/enoyl-CoA hydratase/3-hydroxybutyryl-CoA epimerase
MTGTTAVQPQLTIRKRKSGVAFVIMDAHGKVNLLTSTAMDEFEAAFDQVNDDPEVKAMVLVSGKPDSFIVGADLHEIIKFTSPDQALAVSSRGHHILRKLAACTKPTVAAINGICLGGGLEMVLCCDERIVTNVPATKLGLPEVRLGFIPGLGGTQRLPRLIGLKVSLELILGAEAIDCQRALAVGLVNQIVEPDNLLEAAEAAAVRLMEAGKPDKPNKVVDEMTPEKQKSFFAMAERSVRIKTKGKYPAQSRVIGVIQKGLVEGLDAGLDEEAKTFAELCITDVSRNLVFLFFTSEFVKQSALSMYEKVTGGKAKIGTIGIVGGGMMGTSIAHLAALNGFKVLVKTMRASQQQPTVDKINEQIERLENNQGIRGKVIAAPDFADLSEADVLIEACAEDEAIKASVLPKLAEIARPDCVIATNTSSFAIGKLADNLAENKQNFLGMHFFHPVDKMPLVELIGHAGTNRESMARAAGLICQLGKTPVTVKDSPSFLVNRLVSCYLGQAARFCLDNVPLNWVEDVATDFGMPMGPYTLADEIGLDVAYNVAVSLQKVLGERMAPPAVLKQMLDIGLVGRKTGRGIYGWDANGKRINFDPGLFDLLPCKVSDQKMTPPELQALTERLILPMIDEAARCLEEKVVRRPREIDLCVVLGMGFPPFRGGLLRYADTLGAQNVIDRLEKIYSREPWEIEVSAHLRKLAAEGRGFYTRGSGDE